MALSNVLERLGRAVFESPFGANRLAKEAPELAEVRLAALDAIKANSHRVSGRDVFAFDLVRIHLLGVPEDQAPTFQGDFLRTYFSQELKAALRRSNYRFPVDLEVEFSTSTRLPNAGESWIAVETAMRQVTQAAAPETASAQAILTVINGAANHMSFRLDKARTNIGRIADVFRATGPSRRNDLVFLGEDEASKTVSREHAHIVQTSKTGEYRLINDRVYKGDANCGLWIVRDGLSHPVHRSSRGALLKSGDEIHLASAVIRFSLQAEPKAE
ncbi:MAG: FHA domain-containing protein [Acidobacteriota bacterium]|nr:FHA domain-containing protein [Acidobacteriota bacterium]